MNSFDAEKFHHHMKQRNFSAIRKGFRELNPADIAEVLEDQDYAEILQMEQDAIDLGYPVLR